MSTSWMSTPTPDASSTVKGKLQLAGGLAGTAASPTLVMPAGTVVQSVYTNYSAVNSATNANIPFDDTIPQSGEGTEYMTQAITPTSATNILHIEVIMFCSRSNGGECIAALFQDSTANAIAATSTYMATGTGRVILTINYSMVSGTTSATTFKVRGGGDTNSVFTFNGHTAARYFGAITKSQIKITEVKA